MDRKKDLAVIGRVLLAFTAIYIVFKYLFVIFLPFLLGFAFSRIIRPFVLWFDQKFRIPRSFSACVMLIILTGAVLWLGGMLIWEGAAQFTSFLSQWSQYGSAISEEIRSLCCGIEQAFCLEDGAIYVLLCDNVGQLLEDAKSNAVSGFMSHSVPTLMKLIELGIFFMAMIVSAFFFAIARAPGSGSDDDGLPRDVASGNDPPADDPFRDPLNFLPKEFPFREKCVSILYKLRAAVITFIRTQAVIMLVTMSICTTGLFLLKNPYALLLGILIGFLDALPLIGVGLILIPWTLLSLLMGDITGGAGLFLIFLACYLAREILEPKLMGKGVGISPIISLISIYTGYRLFGIPGVVFGPVGYLILKEIV